MFDIMCVTRTTMKAQELANYLAENLVYNDYEPLITYFPGEGLIQLRIKFSIIVTYGNYILMRLSISKVWGLEQFLSY